MKKTTFRFLLLLLLTVTAVCLLAGCQSGDTPEATEGGTDGTTAADTPADATEAPAPGTNAPATDAPTDAATEAPTEPAETQPAWLHNPTDPAVLTFGDKLDTLITKTSGYTCEVVNDEEAGSVLKVTATMKRKGALTLDYEGYMKAFGLEPVNADTYKYIVIDFKTEWSDKQTFSSSSMTLFYTAGDVTKTTDANSKASGYQPHGDGWQHTMYDLSAAAWAGDVHNFRFVPMDAPGDVGETMYISAIRFYESREEAYTAVGIDMIRPGTGSDLTEKKVEGVNYDKQNAPDEDASVQLWFDHISEKLPQNVTTSTGRNTYVMYLPGNAIEDCQFFLAPETDRSFGIFLSAFTDSKGNTLDAGVYWERYYDVQGVMIPDALPPVMGDIAVKGGNSQGFVIKVKAGTGAPAGLYSAKLDISDAASGKTIKTAKVYAYVWNFSLGDDTRMATAFGMGESHIYNTYKNAGMKDMHSNELYAMYYDFMLENRVCCYNLPYILTDERVFSYLDNPRVTSFGVNWVDRGDEALGYSVLSQKPEWMKKGYFYYVDEPTNMDLLNKISQKTKSLEQNFPGARQLSPFFTDIAVGDVDEIEYLRDHLGIWCVKVNAFTPRSYAAVAGTRYMTSAADDAKYGTFGERMAKEVATGDALWVYYCWEPEQPYCNWMLTDDGTECIVSVWQCRNTGCTGLLYWGTTYWTENLKSAPAGTPVWGDGVLIHSGAEYGIYEPVSSLRLENIRDGIQDYQMLSMLEEKSGAAAADEMAERVSKNVLCYTNDDTYLYTVRTLLGDTVEELYR